jgi:hypothetical protein
MQLFHGNRHELQHPWERFSSEPLLPLESSVTAEAGSADYVNLWGNSSEGDYKLLAK